MPMPPDLSFKHEHCVGAGEPCTDLKAGYRTPFKFADRSSVSGVGYTQKRFHFQEATTAEIRFVISKCPCPYAEYFEDAWRDYVTTRASQGERNRHTKESYLSKWFFPQINGVIIAFCPDDPDADNMAMAGSFRDPIYIDD